MDVVILPTAAEVGEAAAEVIAAIVRHHPEAVLGLATGDSPLGAFAAMARRVEAGELDASRASGFALDEYVGLPPGHPQSYHAVIDRTVTVPLRMDRGAVHVPDGVAADLDVAAEAYERAIGERGVAVQMLGIGANGHIAFNEPGSAFDSRTRVVTLSDRTRDDNARFFPTPGDVPRRALTQGLGTIMRARRIVLVALGEQKAGAVAAAVEGPVTVACPASVLQSHPRTTFFVDEAAASRLTLASVGTGTSIDSSQVRSADHWLGGRVEPDPLLRTP